MQIEELGRAIRFRDPSPELRRRILNDAGHKLWPPFFFAVALAALPFAAAGSQSRPPTQVSVYTHAHETTPVPLSPRGLRLAEK